MLATPATHPPSPLPAVALVAAGPVSAQSGEADLAGIVCFFAAAQVVEGPELVCCTLSGGTETTRFSITVRPTPWDYASGPWCPTNISDGADAVGTWFLDGAKVDVDGAFIANLAETYGDTNWRLFDPETGAVLIAGNLEGCEAAARPNVDPPVRTQPNSKDEP